VNRRTRRLSFLTSGIVGVALLAPSSALASCSQLDAVCAAGEGSGTGQDAPDNTIGPVDDPVEDVVDPVVDTVAPVVDDTVDTVHRVLDDPPVDPPVGGGGGGRHNGGARGGNGPGVGQGPGGGAGPFDDPGRDAAGPGFAGSRLGATTVGPIDSVGGAAAPPYKAPSLGDRFGEAIEGAARSLAIVLGLLSLVAAFVLIQNRLDRKDPRLALAPIESDVVSFA
jgi:hypothetical protein